MKIFYQNPSSLGFDSEGKRNVMRTEKLAQSSAAKGQDSKEMSGSAKALSWLTKLLRN